MSTIKSKTSSGANDLSPGSERYDGLFNDTNVNPSDIVGVQRKALTDLVCDILGLGDSNNDCLSKDQASMDGRIKLLDPENQTDRANVPLAQSLTNDVLDARLRRVFGSEIDFEAEWNDWCPLAEPGEEKGDYQYRANDWVECLHHVITMLNPHPGAESRDRLAHLCNWYEFCIAFPNGDYGTLASDCGWGRTKSEWEVSKFYGYRPPKAKDTPIGQVSFVSCFFYQEHSKHLTGISRGELTCALALLDRQMCQQQTSRSSVLVHSVSRKRIRHIQATFASKTLYIYHTEWTKLTRSEGWKDQMDILKWLLAKAPESAE